MTSPSQELVTPSERPADLPDFASPPVVEVALGIQFAELTAYRTWHTGLLWDSTFRARFPQCIEQPPIEPVFELFGAQPPSRELLRIQTLSGPVVPRLWFISQDNSELVQFQSDRFLHNWRNYGIGAEYPRYEKIRSCFFEELTNVNRFLDSSGIGRMIPNQCEVSYYNHIAIQDCGTDLFTSGNLFGFFPPTQSDGRADITDNVHFEGGRFYIQYIITEPKSHTPRGRLHVSAEPVVEASGSPVIRLSLTARGSPLSREVQGIADFFDLGRSAIVRTFAAITSEKMHNIWGRKT
ncbi:MAG: TIGR04255 family protein [Defluviicoccus sp.]